MTLTDWNSESVTISFTAGANPETTRYRAWLTKRFDNMKLWAAKIGEESIAEAERDQYRVNPAKTFTFEGLEGALHGGRR